MVRSEFVTDEQITGMLRQIMVYLQQKATDGRVKAYANVANAVLDLASGTGPKPGKVEQKAKGKKK